MTETTNSITAYSAMSWPASFVQRRTNREVITISFGSRLQRRNGENSRNVSAMAATAQYSRFGTVTLRRPSSADEKQQLASFGPGK
jgi:hypothetical protein